MDVGVGGAKPTKAQKDYAKKALKKAKQLLRKRKLWLCAVLGGGGAAAAEAEANARGPAVLLRGHPGAVRRCPLGK